jgi:hypothetical protein
MSLSRFALPLVVAGVATMSALTAGCYVSAEPTPVYATTEVTAAPANIETSPTTVYEGRTVYLYNDHWYYRDGARWSYYQTEPPALNRQRHYVQSAPPAQRGFEPGYVPPREAAPPAQHYENRPGEAPPAVRVQ